MIPESFEDRVRFVENMSNDELLLLPIKELKNLCKGMGVADYWRSDKATIVDGMKAYVGQQSDLSLAKELGYDKRYPIEPEVIAKRLYDRLVQAMSGRYTLSQISQISMLVAMGESNLVSPIDGKPLKGNRLKDRRTDILNYLREYRDKDLRKKDENYQKFTVYIEDILSGAWSAVILNRLKLTGQKTSTDYARDYNRRGKNRELKDFHELILWSIDILSNLDKQERWQDVCCALAFMTGRRMSEILATGVFELTEERPYDDISIVPLYYVNFSGQLKGRLDSDNRSRCFTIPVLIQPELILEGIGKLDNMGARQFKDLPPVEAAKRVNNACASTLKKNMAKLPINDLKFSDSRDIYVTALSVFVKNTKTMAQDSFFSEILGHDTTDIKPGATDAYMLFGVTDEWEQKLLGLYSKM